MQERIISPLLISEEELEESKKGKKNLIYSVYE